MDFTEYGSDIFHVKITLNGKDYKIKIPQQEYFISYCPVSDDTESIFPDNDILKLFNKEDIDITKEIYGKFQH
ncbi:hypothetical protein REC12_24015 [Desulfosporosinus sp. PR]|nr:hypothetical protein [Desulfosporosinus sp. PR]